MEIRNVGVLVDASRVDEDLVAMASDLARRNHATLIGVAADAPPTVLAAMDGSMGVAGAVYADQYAEIEASLKAAGESFDKLVPRGVRHRWEASVERPDMAVLSIARNLDIIVVGAAPPTSTSRRLDLGAVLLGSGRPVLLPALGLRQFQSAKILVAWKDTREARRALTDALPLLKLAEDVLVVAVDEGDLLAERASMLDIVTWLLSHDVKARGDMLPDTGGVAQTITQSAMDNRAGLIVSGAYGHRRLREWLLGGATIGLIEQTGLSRLLSN
jgi:nucleotide-binding universal stress UspA family protein